MSRLDFLNPPDDRLEVNGKMYDIDMRLKHVIKFMYLTNDKHVSEYQKIQQGLILLLGDDLSEHGLNDQIEAYIALIDYVSGGEGVTHEVDLAGNPIRKVAEPRITDFIQHFDYIYSAFMQAYGIDLLENRDMDYRKYQALLQSLPKDTYYREILTTLQMDGKGLDADGRRELRKFKKHFEIKEVD